MSRTHSPHLELRDGRPPAACERLPCPAAPKRWARQRKERPRCASASECLQKDDPDNTARLAKQCDPGWLIDAHDLDTARWARAK
eukprot:860042-Pleurochrysis_carterae.AAC.1